MPTQPAEPETANADAPSDETLARRVQCGCVKSYEELDRRLRPRLVCLLLKRTGNREDAEDLTQMALLRAYERIDRFNSDRSFKAWLFTIAIRMAIDAHRKQKLTTTGNRVEHAIDPGLQPDEQLSRRESQHRLWDLADRVLDETQRTALWLHYGEQLKAKQIAKALGISAVHVRVLLYRARRTMLNYLDEQKQDIRQTRTHVVPAPVTAIHESKRLNLEKGAVT